MKGWQFLLFYFISDSVVIDPLTRLKSLFNQFILGLLLKVSSLQQVKFIFKYKEYHMVFKNEITKVEWSAFEFRIT